jgi:hypothetical protein
MYPCIYIVHICVCVLGLDIGLRKQMSSTVCIHVYISCICVCVCTWLRHRPAKTDVQHGMYPCIYIYRACLCVCTWLGYRVTDTYMHTCTTRFLVCHRVLHTYIHIYIHTHSPGSHCILLTNFHTCIHTYIHTCIHIFQGATAFCSEASILLRLRHPNVCGIIGACTQKVMAFIRCTYT